MTQSLGDAVDQFVMESYQILVLLWLTGQSHAFGDYGQHGASTGQTRVSFKEVSEPFPHLVRMMQTPVRQWITVPGSGQTGASSNGRDSRRLCQAGCGERLQSAFRVWRQLARGASQVPDM